MKFNSAILAILFFVLAGCAPVMSAATSAPALASTTSATETPTATPKATGTPLPTATLSPEEQITEIVNKAKSSGEYPAGLTEEQSAAFIEELNKQTGEHLLITPDPSDSNYVYLYVSPELYPNFAEEFAGEVMPAFVDAKNWQQYGDNHNTFRISKVLLKENPQIIERLSLKKWVQMDYEKDEQGQPTGNLRFFYKGEWMTIPNSKDLTPKDWMNPIDKDELAAATESGLIGMPNPSVEVIGKTMAEMMDKNKIEWLPVVLLPLPAEELPRVIVDFKGGVSIDMLPVLTVRFIPDVNGQLIPIGEIVYAANKSTSGFDLLKSGSKVDVISSSADIFRGKKLSANIPLIQVSKTYLLGIYKEPGKHIGDQRPWQGASKIASFVPQDESYQAVTADPDTFLKEDRTIVLMPNALSEILILQE